MKGIIKQEGDLALCYNTYINREANWNEIEICRMNKDNKTRYTIAHFRYNEHEDCYIIESCVDRLDDEEINWENFGKLVRYGYKILNTSEVELKDYE